MHDRTFEAEYMRSDGPLYRWQPKRPRQRRSVTVPTGGVHPLVKLVFAEMARQKRIYDEVEEGSGVRRASMKAWRRKNAPGMTTMTAVLNTLGIDLVPVPAPDVIPTDIAPDLAALSEKLSKTMPETWSALISFSMNQQLARERASAILAKIDEPDELATANASARRNVH